MTVAPGCREGAGLPPWPCFLASVQASCCAGLPPGPLATAPCALGSEGTWVAASGSPAWHHAQGTCVHEARLGHLSVMTKPSQCGPCLPGGCAALLVTGCACDPCCGQSARLSSAHVCLCSGDPCRGQGQGAAPTQARRLGCLGQGVFRWGHVHSLASLPVGCEFRPELPQCLGAEDVRGTVATLLSPHGSGGAALALGFLPPVASGSVPGLHAWLASALPW